MNQIGTAAVDGVNKQGRFHQDSISMRASLLASWLHNRIATIGVVGLGYVGLPLAAAIARTGFTVIGFDIYTTKIDCLNSSQSYKQLAMRTWPR